MAEPATTSTNSHTKIRLTRVAWAAVIVGTVARLLLQILKSDNLATDPDAYVRLSESLAAGNGLSVAGTTLPTAFRPPLLPLLLALPQWLGVPTNFSIATVQLISSVLLLTATYRLAVLVGLSPRNAVVTVCLVACDPLLLLYSTLPMTEVPSAAFLTWAAVFLLHIWQKLSAENFDGIVTAGILAGCCFGFGGLCRPILFVACAVCSIVLFVGASFRTASRYFSQSHTEMRKLRFRSDSDQDPANREQLRTENSASKSTSGQLRDLLQRTFFASVPAMVAATILCPWIIRNAISLEAFVPATTHGGYTLLLGNNPTFYREVVNHPQQKRWSGESLQRWNEQIEKQMAADGIQKSDEVSRDAWMYAKAKANIAADSTSFKAACRLRMKRFWAIVPTAGAAGGSLQKTMIGLFYGLIAVGLIAQLLMNLKQLGKSAGCNDAFQQWLLWSFVLAFLLIHCAYWTNTRMRAPLMPALTALSMVGYVKLGRWYLNRWQSKSELPPSRTALP